MGTLLARRLATVIRWEATEARPRKQAVCMVS